MSLEDMFKAAVKKSEGTQPSVAPVAPVISQEKPAKRPFDAVMVIARYQELKDFDQLSQKDIIFQLNNEFEHSEGQIDALLNTPTQKTEQAVVTPLPPSTVVEAKPVEAPKPTSLDNMFGVQMPKVPPPQSTFGVPPVSSAPPVASVSAVPVITPTKYEEAVQGKIAIMDYANKGEGKTGLALGIVTTTDPNSKTPTVVALSFDRQTAPIKELLYNNDPRIKVFDIIGIMDYGSPDLYLSSAERTFKWVLGLIEEVIKPLKPDWVVIDGADILQNICEMVMRYRNNIMPFQGVSNLNLWKERRMYIRQIHNASMEAVKRGVIYTAYINKDEIIEEGTMKSKTDHPKWIDVIMYETSVVIRAKSRHANDGRLHFFAHVDSSKARLPTGLEMDITGIENMKNFWSKLYANS